MKYLIDTDEGTCVPATETKGCAVDLMEKDKGAKEWDDTVTKIQTWYYGKLVKAAWCATSASYYMNKAGYGITKAQNVYNLLCNCRKVKSGKLYERNELPLTVKRGDVLFWLWKGDSMSSASSKHVGFCETTTSDDTIRTLGGNQNDSICVKTYNKKYLYAIYRPEV